MGPQHGWSRLTSLPPPFKSCGASSPSTNQPTFVHWSNCIIVCHLTSSPLGHSIGALEMGRERQPSPQGELGKALTHHWAKTSQRAQRAALGASSRVGPPDPTSSLPAPVERGWEGRGGDGRHGGQSCGLPQTPGHISSQTDPLLSPPIPGRLCVNSLSHNKSQNKHPRDKTVPQPGQSMKYCLRGWNLPGQPLNPLCPAHGRQ